jgi:hypothetical protein
MPGTSPFGFAFVFLRNKKLTLLWVKKKFSVLPSFPPCYDNRANRQVMLWNERLKENLKGPTQQLNFDKIHTSH